MGVGWGGGVEHWLGVGNRVLTRMPPLPPQYFGIFVEDIEDRASTKVDYISDDAPPYAGLSRTPRPLQSENFMGDVVTVKVRQGQPFKFVFKRKIYLKNLDGPSEDPMWERLVYLQAVDEVLRGNIPIEDADEAASLAAQAMAVDLSESLGIDAEELMGQNALDYIPAPQREQLEPEVGVGRGLRGG